MAARLSALRAGRFLLPGRFLVLLSVRDWVDPRATVRLVGLGQLKKNTSSGTRTGKLPACSIVPQPTTLPRAPCFISTIRNLHFGVPEFDSMILHSGIQLKFYLFGGWHFFWERTVKFDLCFIAKWNSLNSTRFRKFCTLSMQKWTGRRSGNTLYSYSGDRDTGYPDSDFSLFL
jgi:hypothetical protein